MCLAALPLPTAEECARIHYCSVHPTIPLGRRSFNPFGYGYQHFCPPCLANTIAAMPQHPEWFPIPIDLPTLQLVLDLLDQKWGIYSDIPT